MTKTTRRSVLAFGVGALVGGPSVAFARPRERTVAERVAALIRLSRDANGRPHVDRAAVVNADGASGTLPMSRHEVDALRGALIVGDWASLQAGGLWAGGRRFVFLRHDDDRSVIHAARPGEFLTVRQHGTELIVATAVEGMAPGRAVEAVYRYTRVS